ncbi:MAG: hypothetical protein KatS3mg031_0630 [Chitinophagales bacterium]|nr:MAG: hypothetical protein KatS3mg031_0630 [Chitinophagales bacterium]
MRNLLYVWMMSIALYACNTGGGTNASEENKSADVTTSAPNAATPGATSDPAATPPADPAPGNAAFTFEKTEHDFGKIPPTQNVEYTFKFTNTGTEPLVITEAKGSCGCTVPSYPKEPVAVGESGEITVSFDPKGKKGVQRKTVTITANTNPPRTVLTVVSEIVDETPAAAN